MTRKDELLIQVLQLTVGVFRDVQFELRTLGRELDTTDLDKLVHSIEQLTIALK